ncbi:MAG: DUF1232 domain-containing protein [Firmicutes bacterium]|nr:DUF1232 domain-containing protein [Bacillota bacterium]
MGFENIISIDKAKQVLNSGVAQAQELMKDTGKIDELLEKAEKKLQEVPTIGSAMSDLPVMLQMIKSYITKEYNVVSPKVVASMVSSLLYIVTGKDLIPDSIPVLGQLDDIAVIAVALKINEKELADFRAWREAGKPVIVDPDTITAEESTEE